MTLLIILFNGFCVLMHRNFVFYGFLKHLITPGFVVLVIIYLHSDRMMILMLRHLKLVVDMLLQIQLGC